MALIKVVNNISLQLWQNLNTDATRPQCCIKHCRPCGVSQGSTSSSSTCPHYGKSCKITMFNVHHCYADDIQIYVALSPIDYRPIDLLYECIEQVKDWMCQNGLQLNEDKTKIIVFGAKTEQLKKHLHSLSLKGVIMDSDLHFDSHIKLVTKCAYYHLKTITRLKANFHQNRHGSGTASKQSAKIIETILVNVCYSTGYVRDTETSLNRHFVYHTCRFYF